jgi:hypothetical protein
LGDYGVWQDLLAHPEFAHNAHTHNGPSRIAGSGCCGELSSIPLRARFATKAPRWVTEGYATFVEGRVSGHGPSQ